MKTRDEFNNVREIVLCLLRSNERCRNDDKFLTYLVMREFVDIYIPLEDLNKMPAFETIKRCRAHIQNKERRYMPTIQSVINRRKQRQKVICEVLANGN